MTLVLLGALRELLGHGTLLSHANLMFGAWGKHMQLTVIPHHPGFLLAILPPGAFIGLGLLIAGRNWLDDRRASPERQHGRSVQQPGPAENVT
jgi:electron transport complex protein RnfE